MMLDMQLEQAILKNQDLDQQIHNKNEQIHHQNEQILNQNEQIFNKNEKLAQLENSLAKKFNEIQDDMLNWKRISEEKNEELVLKSMEKTNLQLEMNERCQMQEI